MEPSPIQELIRRHLAERAAAHHLRQRQVVQPIDPVRVHIDGREYLNFASNDYLGLTHHPAVTAAMREAIAHDGAGAGAAALISGYTPLHAKAESAIAAWKGTQSAVLLPSGYQANHAAVQTAAAIGQAADRPVRFLIDKLVHASLIDAVRGTGEPFRVFGHNGIDKLRRLLREAPADQLQIVVTESIFSMDGDAADLRALAQLKAEHPFVLVLDEAHASGVYGPNGCGYASELSLENAADIAIVTLSKAMGLMGGAVCTSAELADLLINHARAYIYTTSVAPVVAAGAIAAIDVLQHEPHRQQRLREQARRVRDELKSRGLTVGGLDDSPILPVIVGAPQAALKAGARSREEGILVGAIRPPTVPPGASRLRITLSSEHTDDQIKRLCETLRRVI